ncbi:MAG TPA: hypothetical protein VFX12_10705 [Vicinamibacterales bacterium]|nr:hypothetical protein [Vicinamibacterales bacterium]
MRSETQPVLPSRASGSRSLGDVTVSAAGKGAPLRCGELKTARADHDERGSRRHEPCDGGLTHFDSGQPDAGCEDDESGPYPDDEVTNRRERGLSIGMRLACPAQGATVSPQRWDE